MGGIFGGGSSGTQTVTTQNKIPDWVDKGGEAIFNAGAGLASRPYPTYTDPRIAGFNPDQQNAFDLVRTSSGDWMPSWQTAMNQTNAGAGMVGAGAGVTGSGVGQIAGAAPMIDAAGNYITDANTKVGAAQGYTDAAGKPVGAEDINAYMNPFTDDVINSLMTKMNQQYGREKIDQTAALTARGSRLNEDRRGIIEGVNADNFNNTMAAALANLKMSGFQNALTQANTTKSQQLAAGGQTGNLAALLSSLSGQQGNLAALKASLGTSLGNIGSQLAGEGTSLGNLGGQSGQLAALMQQMQGIDIGNLLGVGGAEQTQQQANLDLAHNDFLNQFNFPQEQLNWLKSLMSGTPYSNTSTQTSPVGEANPWAQILGLVGSGVGAAGSAGAFA